MNYGGSASGPNLNLRALDELDDVFTRRFFFFDSVSGYGKRLRCVAGLYRDRAIVCLGGAVAQLPWTAWCASGWRIKGQLAD